MVTKAEYLNALRSGAFEQGYGALRFIGFNDEYCCLGVYCQLAAPDEWKEKSSFNAWAGASSAIDNHYALRDFGKTLGLSSDVPLSIMFNIQTRLIHMNDGDGDFEGNNHTFAQIADWLEFELDTFVDEILGEFRYTTA